MKRTSLLVGLLLMPCLVVGIVSTSHLSNGLSLAQLRSIFLLKTRIWPDGDDINVYSLPPTHPGFIKFFNDELGLNPYQIEREWYVVVYSGQGYYPTIVPNFGEMRERLTEDKQGIGYLP